MPHPGQTDVSDAAIEAQLRVAPEEAWQALAGAADGLGVGAGRYEWKGGHRLDDGSTTMPWVEYEPAVLAAMGAMGAVGAVVVFDWMNWLVDHVDIDLTSASAADVCRRYTSIVRGDRFGEGTIANALDNGTIAAAMARLLKWHDQR